MKKIINEELIKKIIDSYKTLNIKISESDIRDNDVNYNNVRIIYTDSNNVEVSRFLKDLDIDELTEIYVYQNSIALTNEQRLKNKVAFTTIYDYINKDDTGKTKKDINTRIIDYLTKEIRKKEQIDDDSVRVDDYEKDEETANKGRKKIKNNSTAILVGLIIIGISVGIASCSYKGTKKVLESKAANEENNDANVENEEIAMIPVQVETNNTNAVEEVEENNEDIEENEDDEEINVHSDEFINNVVDKAYENISLLNDQNIAIKYDRDLIEALVRYTHHNYEEYYGENILSNEVAYEDLSELINHKFDISIFYEGLNNYDNLKALYNSTRELKREKAQYEDEFKIYMCMDVVMNEMNTNNFAEAVALRAYVDNYSMIDSMQMAREQAGVLEMKDTSELWLDVNGDNVKTYEENAEGKGYEDEKIAAKSAKYNEMSSETCKNIYKRISTDDQNSELSIIVYKALDEDVARVRTR